MFQWRPEAMVLWVAIVVGGILRVWSPGRIGLWRDEVQFVNIASLPGYRDILSFLYAHESHPPLFYFLGHLLGGLTGDVASATAALTLVASVALIPAGWWLANLTGIRGAGAAAAVLLAVSVTLAYFGVQLRPYSLVSLFLIAGVGALIKAVHTGKPGWKLAWALIALGVLYLHHVGVFVVLAEVISLLVLARRRGRIVAEARGWSPWLALVVILSLPDMWLLLHQSRLAGYTALKPLSLLGPLGQLAALAVALPGEVILSCAGGVAALWAGIRKLPEELGTGDGRATVLAIGTGSVALLLLLLAASYRAYFMAIQVVMATVPLGLVATGTVIAYWIATRRKWTGALWIELAVFMMGLSNIFAIGTVKSNTDLVAQYVAAEARDDDLLLVTPGASGPAFDRYVGRTLSQINFPMVGPVTIYPFDRNFERVASEKALRVALDSITAVCVSGRRLWLAQLPYWLNIDSAPARLSADSFGGLGQADQARANFLQRAVTARFGPPVRVVNTGLAHRGLEQFSLELFIRPPENDSDVLARPCLAR